MRWLHATRSARAIGPRYKLQLLSLPFIRKVHRQTLLTTVRCQSRVFGKIIERVIAADVTNYLLSNNLLNASQHGFLSRRSTLTNLLESVNAWAISIENKHQNRVAYIDFSRAFDSVSHTKLLHKLKSYGINGILLEWISDFLSERMHCTRVGNVFSSFRYIRSGVVQGSCLGPQLFLIYTVSGKKRDQHVFCNISYKTRAIMMKFGT